MRILLDESIPRQLAPLLTGHDDVTVPKMGWAGAANGELLSRAAVEFDVLITGDQSMQDQQNLAGHDLGLVVVAALNNRVETICALAPQILRASRSVERGRIEIVSA